MRDGVILAGGRSRRFGEADKAIAELAGVPMIRRVADRLATVVDELVVNCRSDQVEDIAHAVEDLRLDVRFATDPEPDQGPLVGIRTGLRRAEAQYAAVVACDMPFVDPGFLGELFDRAAGHDAAVARLEDGWYQTTQAVYRREAMAEACDRAVNRGDRRVVDAFDDLDVVVLEEADVLAEAPIGTFDNVNTPAEFEAAAARIDEG